MSGPPGLAPPPGLSPSPSPAPPSSSSAAGAAPSPSSSSADHEHSKSNERGGHSHDENQYQHDVRGGDQPLEPLDIFNTGTLGTSNSAPQASATSTGAGAGSGSGGASSISTIVKAQIVFLLSTLTEESWERNVGEIRTLISQNSPEMYHHFLRRLITVTSPVLNLLSSQIASIGGANPDTPLSTPLTIPMNGAGVLAWRVLESEAKRASKDPLLAPHFVNTLLVPPTPSTPPPISINLLNFSPAHVYALACNVLLSPHLIPNGSNMLERAVNIIQNQHEQVVNRLMNPHIPFWDENSDLTADQAKAIVLAQYPLQNTAVHAHQNQSQTQQSQLQKPLPLDTHQRQQLLTGLTVKFSSPALILQILPYLAPGPVPLADVLMELGDGLTADESVVAAVVSKWWQGRQQQQLEEEVAKTIESLILGMEIGRGVDLGGVMAGIRTACPSINWAAVVRWFDKPGSVLKKEAARLWLYHLLTGAALPPHAAIDGVLPSDLSEEWKNSETQLVVLDFLLSIPPERLSLAQFPTMNKLITQEDLSDLPQQVQESAHSLMNSSWNVKQVSLALAHSQNDGGAIWESIMDRGMQLVPELVLLGFAQYPKPWSQTHEQLVSRLLADFADGRPNSPLVFTLLGRINPGIVLDALCSSYDANELNVTKIVDAGQYAGILDKLLTSDHFNMALDVAAVASRKDIVDLESWALHSIETHGSDFVTATLDFLESKVHSESGSGEEPTETTPLTSTVFATFFRALRRSNALDADDVAHFKEIRNYCLQVYPRLMNLDPNSEQEPGLQVVTYPADVEAQVEEFYQRMFKEYISLDQVVDEFKRLKASVAHADQQLFGCMLHTLFDEYKFVKMYPHRQLAMAGIIFGSIIQNRLIESTPLHVAIRYVLDAVSSPPEMPMFTFGKDALKIFAPRLHDFPLMCQALLEIPHLHDEEPSLVNSIKQALAERHDDEEDEEPIVFTAVRIDDLDETTDPFNTPNENLSDKMLFIINNLAPMNFDDKVNDMKTFFSPRWSRWFAQYLINTRVAVEPNNHELYQKLMTELGTPTLEKHILHETYVRVYNLLNSSKTMNDTHERKILDNLGAWLGRLTVARDLPIRHRQLAVKDLLVQGYAAKRLKLAIPFVCQIMRQCSKSRVFHWPNPWVVAILRVLSELYHFGDLSLQLKFDIERVCKSLDVQLADIEPSDTVRTRLPTEAPGGLALELERFTAPTELPAQAADEIPDDSAQNAYLRRVDELVSQLPDKINFGPAHAMFQSNATLKRIVLVSIDKAVRELINPVVERSVTIAGISSRDLLLKDFGMEGDENKLRMSAHLMVSKLAGSLALVSCKEPLRTSMTKTMRESMLTSGFTEETLPEQAVSDVIGANLDVACSIIKTAAQEKAINDIDVNLAKAYAVRRQARESGQPFYQPSPFTALVARSALPEALRLGPQGLQPSQVRVYEDFSDHSRFFTPAAAESTAATAADYSSTAPTPSYPASRPASVALGEVVESSILGSKTTVAQSVEKFQEMVAELVTIVGRTSAENLAILPLHHDIKMIIRQVPVVATQSINPDQSALAFSQKVVQLLYRSEGNLGREVFVTILQRLCDLFPKVAKEVTQWLIYAEDARKFNVPVTIALVRAGLIRLPELDAQLAKMILREFAPAVLDFTSGFIREAVLTEQPVAQRQQFAASLDALSTAAVNQRATEQTERLLEDLQLRSERPQQVLLPSSIDTSALGIYFLEWVRLFTSTLPVEASFVPFVNRLQKQGVLKGEEISSAFYRTSISLAIDMYSTHKASGSPQMFHGVDALSKLIALLLKNYSDTHGVSSDSAKTLYFAKIFTIAALSLVRDHEERGPAFEQRPYFRFFSSLLSDLQSIQTSFPQAYYGCLRTFANHLGSIQPAIVPSFAYSWMALISHRYFMPRLLQVANKEGWADFYRVLMALFKFLNPFLQSNSLHQPSRILFRGALRILLVILKDFPEFLVEHYIGLCAAIPAHCIQLRNVVLCAFPRGMTLRPEIESLSDLPPLPEFHVVPEIRTDYARFLDEAKIRQAIDSYVQYGQPDLATILPEVRSRIAISASSPPQVTYNLTLLYSLTLYLGSSAVKRSIDQRGQVIFDHQAPEVLLLTSLVASLDGEGQYNFLNSVVNQLRFPSAHTFFFMLYILHLFTSSPRDGHIPERITRVLLERVIAQRPHPWGVTTTFSELLHNEKLGFWTFPWVRAEPELFSIFNRCLGK